jgi:glutamate-5-semialdehyde dehydrogenase
MIRPHRYCGDGSEKSNRSKFVEAASTPFGKANSEMNVSTLETLTRGGLIPVVGSRAAVIPPDLAERYRPGDQIIVLQDSGELVLIPAEEHAIAASAVDRAVDAFRTMSRVSDDSIARFFSIFASRLADESCWAPVAAANATDVEIARASRRSTTRLVATSQMRADMIAGLHAWRDEGSARHRVVGQIEHDGWTVEQVIAPLGVVGFVFEGRPNVFADAVGVLRTGNTVVFRIGRDALGTARAIVTHALDPAMAEAGLPPGAATLVDSASHSSAWALFSDRRLSLAVARGSGRAVATLGSIARQAGIPVSLHGTGGAWLVADHDADADWFRTAVLASLDRKVCNTLNVCLIHQARAADLVPAFLDALHRAGKQHGGTCKLHIVAGDEHVLPDHWLKELVCIKRPEGDKDEPLTETMPADQLGQEWEWEDTPEVTLKIVSDLDEAIELFNRYSPQFVASLISPDSLAQQYFFDRVNAPFICNGFTRWVDGQYALNKPELGLSNWEHGRLLGRGAILSGDSVFTIKTRVVQHRSDIRR